MSSNNGEVKSADGTTAYVEVKPKKFQARKPKLDEDDLEEKVKKLEKINSVIESNNPWLARILESRQKR
mgnify:CR=1 FL=1